MLLLILRNAEESVSPLFCPPFPLFLKILQSCWLGICLNYLGEKILVDLIQLFFSLPLVCTLCSHIEIICSCTYQILSEWLLPLLEISHHVLWQQRKIKLFNWIMLSWDGMRTEKAFLNSYWLDCNSIGCMLSQAFSFRL